MDFQSVTPSEAKARVLQSMGVRSAGRIQEHAELLRMVVWSHCSRVGTADFEEVHVLRILNTALETCMCILNTGEEERSLRDTLRERLDELCDAGDLLNQGEGRWLPAAPRLVPLGEQHRSLLVGGLPTSLLPEGIRALVEHSGCLRFVPGIEVKGLAMRTESLESWAQVPNEDLLSWGKAMLQQELEPYREPMDGLALSIYAPQRAAMGAPQFKRWGPGRKGLSGRYLAQRRRVFGLREFRVVEVEKEALVAVGGVFLPGEPWRLMYAADALAGNPIVAKWSEGPDGAHLVLPNGVPRPEQRLFSALGRKEPDTNRWHFPNAQHHQIILDRLIALGVSVSRDSLRSS